MHVDDGTHSPSRMRPVVRPATEWPSAEASATRAGTACVWPSPAWVPHVLREDWSAQAWSNAGFTTSTLTDRNLHAAAARTNACLMSVQKLSVATRGLTSRAKPSVHRETTKILVRRLKHMFIYVLVVSQDFSRLSPSQRQHRRNQWSHPSTCWSPALRNSRTRGESAIGERQQRASREIGDSSQPEQR